MRLLSLIVPATLLGLCDDISPQAGQPTLTSIGIVLRLPINLTSLHFVIEMNQSSFRECVSELILREVWKVHYKNSYSISFQIEWDMIVVTVILSILNQMGFYLVQNRKKNCHHDDIPAGHPTLKSIATVLRLTINLTSLHLVIVFREWVSELILREVCKAFVMFDYDDYRTLTLPSNIDLHYTTRILRHLSCLIMMIIEP